MAELTGDEFYKAVDRGVREAVALALMEHKRLGHTIVVEQDGKIVHIPPEEIPDQSAVLADLAKVDHSQND